MYTYFKDELGTKVGTGSHIMKDPFAELITTPLGSDFIESNEQGKANKVCRKKPVPIGLVLIHTAHAHQPSALTDSFINMYIIQASQRECHYKIILAVWFYENSHIEVLKVRDAESGTTGHDTLTVKQSDNELPS